MTYVLEQVDSEYAYQITYGGKQFECPAPSSRLSVQSGALRAITALSYDGSNYEEISILLVRRDWDKCEYEIDVPPPAAPLVAEGLVYNYYFLYIEPVSGAPTLDLVCNEINLESGGVTAKIYKQIHLLKLKTLDASPEQRYCPITRPWPKRFNRYLPWYSQFSLAYLGK